MVIRRKRLEVVEEEEEVLEEEVEEVREDREEPAEDSVEEAQESIEEVAAQVTAAKPDASDAVPVDNLYRELIEFARSLEKGIVTQPAKESLVDSLVHEILALYGRYCELRRRKRELVTRNQVAVAVEGFKSMHVLREFAREVSRVEREMRSVRKDLLAKLLAYRDRCGMRCSSCPIKHVCRELMR